MLHHHMITITRLYSLTLAVLAGSLLAAGQDSLTNGLVAYYPFNGNAKDESGNGHHGTPTKAGLTADRFGLSNAAFAFDGTNSVITVAHSDVLNLTNTDFTISLWAVLNAPKSVSPQFFLLYKGDGSKKWLLSYGGSDGHSLRTVFFQRADLSKGGLGNAWYVARKDYTVNSNEWHHFSLSKAGSTYTMYVDGLPFDSASSSLEPLSANTSALTIGRGENLSIRGKLDDIRIYNRALSSSELQQLYDSESGLKVALIKFVKPSFSGLFLGTNYQLQVSSDFASWTNEGAPFTATHSSMTYPQYWDVENWNELFFRLQVAP
jgi:hypothetical protein